ncbi:MAG: glutathione synthase [Desulfobacteraceae bacterium]|nr:glutathione synthase [Desulfobacteraceae bacterium]
MIVSYHPCFVADVNRICAGRKPDEADRAAMADADAVILGQGCYPSLYRMAREACDHVFPNYDARLAYPGKTGQIRLFSETGTPHPASFAFPSVADYQRRFFHRSAGTELGYPFVFKFDWGGEGEAVYRVDSRDAFSDLLERAARWEKSGQRGFVLQSFVPSGGRCLRVATIGRRHVSYWRRMDDRAFQASLAAGGAVDRDSDPQLQEKARRAVDRFCRTSGIDLAGFDILFAEDRADPEPLFLEINYFFGREGLGGSDRFYLLLVSEIHRWLKDRGLVVSEG